MTSAKPPSSGVRIVLGYTVARLLLLVAVFAVLYAVGLRGLPLIALAVLGSGVVSYVALAPQRIAMAQLVESRYGPPRPNVLKRRIEGAQAREDAVLDAQERAAGRPPTTGADAAGPEARP